MVDWINTNQAQHRGELFLITFAVDRTDYAPDPCSVQQAWLIHGMLLVRVPGPIPACQLTQKP
jgi:hypothetical protein